MTRPTCPAAGCDRPVRANGYCNAHHLRRKQGSRLPETAPIRSAIPDWTGERRLRDKVVWNGECLLWQGRLTYAGYGHLNLQGRFIGVHRVAYELAKGPIPAGLEIDHLCAVRHCVNPDHLEAVTHAENLRRARERQAAAS